MTADVRTRGELARENAVLRAQLEEVQETLRAVREGEIDALVVSTPAGEQVFTLQGADHAYRVLVEQMHEGAVTLAPDSHIAYSNMRFAEMLALPLERVIGTPLRDYVVRADRAAFNRLLDRARQASVRGEVQLCNGDGRYVPVYLGFSPLDVNGESSVCVVVTDLTERKHAEQALASERHARSILNQAQDGIVVCDTRGQVTFANAAARKLAWLDPTDTDLDIGPEVWDRRFDPEGRPILPEDLAVSRALRGETIVGRDVRMVRDDGSTNDILAAASPLRDAEGQIFGAVITFSDITEKRKAQEALLEADRRKDEFLATLAHELRNPLAPIRTGLHLLMRTGADPETTGDILGMMRRQTDHLVRLVDDLLDVSRITRGKITLRKERLDLAQVIRQAVEASQPLVEAGRHTLSITLPPEPVHVEGDMTRLAQVLSNIINNAAKYTPEGGRIGLTVETQGQEAVVRVQDTGLGIPAEMLPRVFELFTQVDHSLGRSQGGLGIGLTLVKRLVELHGGTVGVASGGPDQGSEFIVRLPLAAPARSGRAEVGYQAESSPGPGRRILVVDDNVDAALSLARLLQITGHEVHSTHDGLSALAAAAVFEPDVMLLDLGMPGMDGYEVARRVRECPPLRNIVVVALTGWGQEEDHCRTQDAGFDHHLVKPVDLDELEATLRRITLRR